jgi:2-hydroxy-6-oxonona-2,4-dienedioate hydrolase
LPTLSPTYENISRILQQMIYDPNMISRELIQDFINRMKLPNLKYAFMSILTSLNEHSKLADDRLKIDIPTLVIWGRSDKILYAMHRNSKYSRVKLLY